MPTYDSVAGALAFDDNGDSLNLPSPLTLPSSFAIELTLDLDNTNLAYYSSGLLIMDSSNNLRFYDTTNAYKSFPSGGITGEVKLLFTKDGNNLSAELNDSQIGTTQDVTGLEYQFQGLGRATGAGNTFKVKSYKQWNSAVSTGTPDFELDASDPTTMLNDSDAQPVNGDSVRLWHDPSAVDVVAFDGDSINGLTLPSDYVVYLELEYDSIGFVRVLNRDGIVIQPSQVSVYASLTEQVLFLRV